jgi:FkbM family methyltransferase
MEFIPELLTKDPIRAMDIGAHGGLVEHWLPFLSWMRIDAFEPNKEDCERQKEASPPHVSWHPIGLARESGEHTLYVLNRSTGSSLYPVNVPVLSRYTSTSYYGLVKEMKIQCLSLSDFLEQNQKLPPNVLKLDTQGSELDILYGLEDSHWNAVLSVETEVEFLELYKDQPLFQDVHAFMLTKGFELFDLRTHRGYRLKWDEELFYLKKYLNTKGGTPLHSAQLVAGDALYLRTPEDSRVYESLSVFGKYVMSLVIYHYFDVALFAVEMAEKKGLLNATQREALFADILSFAPKPPLYLRTDLAGKISTRIRHRLGITESDYPTFWTSRRWPDQ